MAHTLKLLLMAVGGCITCIVCGIAFLCLSVGKERTKPATETISSVCQYNELREYENRNIKGSQLIELMNEYEGSNLYFLVKTKECVALRGVFYNRDDKMQKAGRYSKEQSPVNQDYINETALFECKVAQNDNLVIVGITFTQK